MLDAGHPVLRKRSSRASLASADTVVPRSVASSWALRRTSSLTRKATWGDGVGDPFKDGRPTRLVTLMWAPDKSGVADSKSSAIRWASASVIVRPEGVCHVPLARVDFLLLTNRLLIHRSPFRANIHRMDDKKPVHYPNRHHFQYSARSVIAEKYEAIIATRRGRQFHQHFRTAHNRSNSRSPDPMPPCGLGKAHFHREILSDIIEPVNGRRQSTCRQASSVAGIAPFLQPA